MSDCKKKRGKKDRATAEARTRKHKARRIARDERTKRENKLTREALQRAGLPTRAIRTYARAIRRGQRVA